MLSIAVLLTLLESSTIHEDYLFALAESQLIDHDQIPGFKDWPAWRVTNYIHGAIKDLGDAPMAQEICRFPSSDAARANAKLSKAWGILDSAWLANSNTGTRGHLKLLRKEIGEKAWADGKIP